MEEGGVCCDSRRARRAVSGIYLPSYSVEYRHFLLRRSFPNDRSSESEKKWASLDDSACVCVTSMIRFGLLKVSNDLCVAALVLLLQGACLEAVPSEGVSVVKF